MAGYGTRTAEGEPGTGSQDPKAGKGILPGGITPQIQGILERMPADERSAVEQHFLKTSQYVTAERQRLTAEVKKSGVLDKLCQDPQFNRYLEARSRDDVATFLRNELKATGESRGTLEARDNLAGQEDESTSEFDSDHAKPQTAAEMKEIATLKARLEQLEATTNTFTQDQLAERQRVDGERFMKAYPEWEQYLPAMQQVRNRFGDANVSLDDIYHLAVREVEQGLASLAPAEGQQQQAPASPAAPPAEISNGVSGVKADAAKTSPGHARTVEEAFQEAKRMAGLRGDVEVRFS